MNKDDAANKDRKPAVVQPKPKTAPYHLNAGLQQQIQQRIAVDPAAGGLVLAIAAELEATMALDLGAVPAADDNETSVRNADGTLPEGYTVASNGDIVDADGKVVEENTQAAQAQAFVATRQFLADLRTSAGNSTGGPVGLRS